MSDPVVYDKPFRLRVQIALVTSLASISTADGYTYDLAGKVFRGRDMYGDSDPLPMVSILEPPLPIDQVISPQLSKSSLGDWDLLVQGFCSDDPENPTDPAHMLLADVKRKLTEEKVRTAPDTRGQSDPFGMGRSQIVEGKAIGNTVSGLIIGPGVVRPPEAAISNKAYFWLGLTLKITEDTARPFM